jgi:NADPH2:quinone reductase
MKALVCRSNAEDLNALRFEDMILPALPPDHVRLRVRAASVNFPDILMAQGKYQHRPPLPYVVGGEMAGEVKATALSAADFQAPSPRRRRRLSPRCAPFPTARISRPLRPTPRPI